MSPKGRQEGGEPVRRTGSTDREKGENATSPRKRYAFREDVNGQVSVGKVRAPQIEDAEFALVPAAIRHLDCDCRAEIKGEAGLRIRSFCCAVRDAGGRFLSS